MERTFPSDEAALTSLLREAPVAIGTVRVYAGGTIQCEYLSPGHQAIFSYQAEQFLADGALWLSGVLPEDRRTAIAAAFDEVIAERSGHLEYRFRWQDGSLHWIATRFSSKRNAIADCWDVTVVSFDITDYKQADLALRQSVEQDLQAIHRERLIAAISSNIRQSLDLDYILSTTVEELQQFLQIDRVLIYRFNPDWSGSVVAEATEDEAFSILNRYIDDPCFRNSMLTSYRQGRVYVIDDVWTVDLPECYANLLRSLQVRAALVIPILVRQDLWGLLVAHQCTSPRRWQQSNWQLLQQLSTQLAIGIHQAELHQQTQHQADKERMQRWVIQAIRNSLDLNTLFATATTEIGGLLHADRAEIVQFLPDEKIWLNVASYRRIPDLPDALGLKIPDEDNPLADRLKRLETVLVSDYATATDHSNRPMTSQYPGTWLLVPLHTGQVVWGSLSLNRRSIQRPWQSWEVEIAEAVADQLAIAIQQSELYQQVQQLNTTLESQVHERTEQLQQTLRFEDLLRRITDKVRDSLDEAQILQTAVQELAVGMDLLCCDAGLYDEARRTLTICYEHLRSEALRPAKGTVLLLDEIASDVNTVLLRGHNVQFCILLDSIRQTERIPEHFSVLSCPLVDDRGVLGDMWLFRPAGQIFTEQEVRVAQQIATQCAIAVRQSRLYQESQAQVTELARLNQLKDDFLSTVSHELRTPLSNIKMAIQMLEICLHQFGTLQEGSSGTDRYFQILKEECQRETDLINNLLEVTRLDAGTEPLILTPIDLKVLIPHIAEPLADRMQQQQQQLVIDIPAKTARITTDLTYLERILTELLTNASKYTPVGETITVSVQSLDRSTRIQVSNTGIEIPEEERDRIFDKFYRIPNQDPWKYSGTGMGLALVKRLSERLGATIQVSSSPGMTTFTLEFSQESSLTR